MKQVSSDSGTHSEADDDASGPETVSPSKISYLSAGGEGGHDYLGGAEGGGAGDDGQLKAGGAAAATGAPAASGGKVRCRVTTVARINICTYSKPDYGTYTLVIARLWL